MFEEAEQIVKEVKKDFGFLEDQREIVKQKRRRDDEVFRFTGIIPLEQRKSERLSNTKPKYSYKDLERVEGFAEFDDEKDPVGKNCNNLNENY